MRLGSYIFHVKRTVVDDIVSYSDPIRYKLRFNFITIMPATVALNNMSGFYTTEEYGEHEALGWNGIANADAFHGTFHVGDLLFLDGALPSNKEKGANAIITSVREQNRVIYLTIKELEGMQVD